MKINFIPIDYDYFDYQGKNYAKIIGRTDNQKKVCIIDTCDVYIWAIFKPKTPDKKIKQIQAKIEKIRIKGKQRESRVLKTEIHNKNFLGNPVKAIKIFISNYKDAHDIADEIGFKEIDKRREYDLGFITKYILERKLKPLTWYEIEGNILTDADFGGIINSIDLDYCFRVNSIKELTSQLSYQPKILAYDIETDEFEIGKGHILMISLVGTNFRKVLTWKGRSSSHLIETFKNEAEMLEAFVKYIKEYDPDILAGYFSDGFDLPYLRARAEHNKIKLNLGIDNSQPSFSRGRMLTGKIKGIIHVDLLRFIKTAYAQYLKSETLSLNEVASELLGEKKTEWKHKHSSKIDGKDWKKYFEYNLQDSILAFKLTEKLWPDLLEVTKITQEPLFNTSRAGLSSIVENYIIHNIEKFNEIIEKRPVYDEIGQRRASGSVEGAFVYQPKPGLYENITIFDFTSMHTSIIVSFNISKATLLKKKEKNSFESPEISEKNKKIKFYFSKKQGFFPALLKEIFEKRKKFKQEYKKNPNPITKARSNVFKLLSASVHGYQAFFGARYYSREGAASVLAFVRKFNKQIINKINKQKYNVIYADTDSVIFTQNKYSKKQTLTFLKKLNSQLPGIMELDLEGFFKRGIWVTKRTGDLGAKKKYALIDENNKIKIRGFETVRRDWCNLARQTQNKVLELILKEGNEKKALEYVKKIIKQIKNRETPLEQLIIKTQLKKSIEEYKAISPHVTIARKMKEQELPVNIGMLIKYYISETKEKKALVRDRAKMPEESGRYDIEYYLKNQILPAIENIFEIFNIDLKQILDGKKQTCLTDF